jgi:hypothetical protein
MARKRSKPAQPKIETANLSWKRLAINAFLIFHMVGVACWSLPLTNPLAVSYKNLIRPYFLWAGLFQSWDMFSPTPKFVNTYVEAIVLRTDGNTQIWRFPRMEKMGFIDRYTKERYRKFVETINNDSSAALWPDVARFIARHADPSPVPVNMVLLVRYWSPIVPRGDNPSTPEPWDEHVFYSYTVTPGDLK